MACFLVPTAEAIVTGVVSKVEKKNEVVAEGKIPFSRKLKWLKNMLWGGAALLAYEHVWHGEVVPWFPFLTAAANPEDAAVMLHEMATVGVTMALLVTAAWGCIALAADKIVNAQTVLDAHKTLMDVDEENVKKFEKVVDYVQKDLDKLNDKKS